MAGPVGSSGVPTARVETDFRAPSRLGEVLDWLLVVERVGGGGLFGGIKRLFGIGGPEVDLRFQDRAAPGPDDAVRELRDLGTDLPPGRYRMIITVTNEATAEEARSETIFEVTG